MAALRIQVPIDVVGPVSDTRDEAVAVSRLAKARGWSRVIVVTHPWHTRRAAAAFEKAGIRVIRAPCPDGELDRENPSGPGDRFSCFRRWAHEWCGYYYYRLRGWV